MHLDKSQGDQRDIDSIYYNTQALLFSVPFKYKADDREGRPVCSLTVADGVTAEWWSLRLESW
jgi:hypothetical protein